MPFIRGRRPNSSIPNPIASPSAASTTAPVQRPLPAYEPPTCPLSASALRSLTTFAARNTANSESSNAPYVKLRKKLKDASLMLNDVVDSVNEMAVEQEKTEKERRKRKREKERQRAATEGADTEEADVDLGEGGAEELGRRVKKLTAEIEVKVRTVIDAQAKLDARGKMLKDVVAELGNDGGNAATQSTLGASQFRNGSRPENSGEDGGGRSVPDLLKSKMGTWQQKYEGMDMREKYSRHNDYKAFKDSLHSAYYKGNSNPPPLSHSSTWFKPDPSNAGHLQPSLERQDSRRPDNRDSDSEIEAVSVSIQVKCPISLRPMKDPVRSQKCPHAFEKWHIEEMIKHSPDRRNGVLTLKCPVCEVPLTLADLAPDPVLKRNIERIEAAERAKERREAEGEDGEDDGSQGDGGSPKKRAQSVDSSYEAQNRAQATQIKAEKVRSSNTVRSSVVPSTQLDAREGEADEGAELEDSGSVPPPRSTAEIVDLGEEYSDDDDDDGSD